MKISRLLMLACALALPPTIALVPGCSGGGSSSSGPNIPSNLISLFDLANNQSGQLILDINRTVISGQLVVTDGVVAQGRAAKVQPMQTGTPFSLIAGTYAVSGTFTRPRSYSLTVTLPDPIGTLTITGLIPSKRQDGSYTITQLSTGQTFSGILPATGTTQPTATPSVTPTATATPSVPTTNSLGITFSSVTGVPSGTNTSDYQTSTLNGNFFSNSPTFVLTSFFELTSGGVTRKITFEGPALNRPVVAGDIFDLSSNQASGGNVYYSELSGGVEKSWEDLSGQIRIDSATANSVTFTLINVKMQPGFNANGATGTFTLNGNGSLLDATP